MQSLEEFIKGRVEENKQLFSKRELAMVKSNINVVNKIYIIAMLDIHKTIKDV